MAINILIFGALAAVVLTLFGGLFNMVHGGENKATRSNKLMRLRVVLQAVALIALMVGFYLKSRTGG
ncbi:MAG: hypothetical protein COA47_00595 [Robiginitomaculum sp.]|nr:MAG: hypothetical protein COA47_00595 [Robiginitomaculum sp.]